MSVISKTADFLSRPRGFCSRRDSRQHFLEPPWRTCSRSSRSLWRAS